MKRLTLFLLLIGMPWTLQARRAKTVKKSEAAVPVATVEAPVDVDRHLGRYRDVDMMVEKAKRDAEFVQRRAERDAQDLAGKVRQKQSRLERRRQELLNKDAREVIRLEMESKQDSQRLKQEAEAKAARILQEAEQKAQELKALKAMEDRADREKNRPRITKEWRREIKRDFENDIAFLRQIIIEGETSRNERQNFITLFNEQLSWATDLIEKTQYFFDDHYTAVVAKRNAVAALVDAQRQADDIILDIVDQHHLSAQVHAHLRLMALYELNNHLNNSTSQQLFLDADVIRNLVTKIGHDFAPGVRDIKIVSEKERVASLERRIAELEAEVSTEEHSIDVEMTTNLAAPGQAQPLLTDHVQDTIIAINKEKDEKLAQVERMAREQCEELERRLTSEKEAEISKVKEEMARIQKDKDVQVAQIQKYMKERIEAAHKEYQKERDEHLASLKEQLADLQKEKEFLQARMQTQEHAYAQERSELVDMIEKKQKEQVGLELALANVSEHLRLLSQQSYEHVSDLTQSLEERGVANEALVKAIELKTREQIELELAITRVKEQLEWLTYSSKDALSTMEGELALYQDRCLELGDALKGKQREAVELEAALRSLRATLKDVKVDRADYVSSLEKVEALNGLLDHMSRDKRAVEQDFDLFSLQMNSLIEGAEKQIANLVSVVETQRDELSRKEKVYEEMRDLQGKLDDMRAAREQDAQRDSAHTKLLSQMATFGNLLMQQYATTATLQSQTNGLAEDLFALRGSIAPGNEEKVLCDMDALLTSLSRAVKQSVPTPSVPSVSASIGSDLFSTSVPISEESEEEDHEVMHEPDEGHDEDPGTPQPYSSEESDQVATLPDADDTQTKRRRNRRQK